jgi:hypothetical protein
VAPRRHHQAGSADAVGIELLHDHPVEQRPQLMADRLERPMMRSCAHATQDIPGEPRETRGEPGSLLGLT